MTCPVAAFLMVTCAPATTAPEGSLTVPTMLPVPTVVCANNGAAALTAVTKRRVGTSRPLAAAVRMKTQLTPAGSCAGAYPCIAGRSAAEQKRDLRRASADMDPQSTCLGAHSPVPANRRPDFCHLMPCKLVPKRPGDKLDCSR